MNKKLGISVVSIVIVAILAGFFLGQMIARTQSPASVPTPSSTSVSISGISYLIYPAVIGAITGAIASFILMYLVYNMMFKKERRRELLEKRLEKLYSPLYTFTKRLKEENESAIPKDIMRIVELIEKNCYLASEELQPFLTLMVQKKLKKCSN
jgi:ABC-type transport system substrate-binding protein